MAVLPMDFSVAASMLRLLHFEKLETQSPFLFNKAPVLGFQLFMLADELLHRGRPFNEESS